MTTDYLDVLKHIDMLMPDEPCNCEQSQVLELWMSRMVEIINDTISANVHALANGIEDLTLDRDDAISELEAIETAATRLSGVTKMIMNMIQLRADD